MILSLADSKFERIGGTATGGGTFWGLGSLITGAQGFDELLELASKGDHRKVDMLVKDIYGDRNNYQSLGLPPDIIASTFGKAIHHPKASSEFTDADKARSLLYMISNDIGQISSLYAMLHKVSFHMNVFPCSIRLCFSRSRPFSSAASSFGTTPFPCTPCPSPSTSGPRARCRPCS